MASSSRSVTLKSFFKVILLPTLQARKMKIPIVFVASFGGEFSDTATLRVQDGLVWKVALTKEKGDIWFDEGWNDFVEFYSISDCYFLVFRYGDDSNFQVSIFDHSACKIKYPFYVKESEEEEENESADEMHINEHAQATKGDGENEEDEHSTERILGQNKLVTFLEKMGIYMCKAFSKEEREKAKMAANLFKPKNPSFMVIIRAYFISNNFMYVPTVFCKKYLSNGVECVKLQFSDDKVWPVYLREHLGSVVFSRGWTNFVRAMDLHKGDILLFELVRIKDILLKVKVVRASSD